MRIGANAVKAGYFTRQIKSGDMFNPVCVNDEGFNRAGMHGENRGEIFTVAVKMFSRMDHFAALNDRIQFMDVAAVHGHRQAQMPVLAFTAGMFVITGREWGLHGVASCQIRDPHPE